MNQTVLFTIIVLVIVFAVTVSSYFHKRHMEYKMSDIEKAVRKSFPKGVDSITKQELVTGIKKHFHCSAKEAHYIPNTLPTITPVPTATPTIAPSATPET